MKTLRNFWEIATFLRFYKPAKILERMIVEQRLSNYFLTQKTFFYYFFIVIFDEIYLNKVRRRIVRKSLDNHGKKETWF